MQQWMRSTDILFADQNHLGTVDRAGLIFIQKRDDCFFNLQTFKKLLMGCLLFAGMLPDQAECPGKQDGIGIIADADYDILS